VARQLITSHGGHIDITSQVYQGTTVTVTLPLSALAGGIHDVQNIASPGDW
jgi:signal transduction histidine kinase